MQNSASRSLRLSPGELAELSLRADELLDWVSAGDVDTARNVGENSGILAADRAIAGALQSVPIPARLRESVLSAIDNHSPNTSRRHARWPLGLATAAASFLFVCWMLQGSQGTISSETLVVEAASVYTSMVESPSKWIPGLGEQSWPESIDRSRGVAHKDIAFFGGVARAYHLVAGHHSATLIVVDKSRFPYRVPNETESWKGTRGSDVYLFSSNDDQVCLLVLPSGVDPHLFQNRLGVT